MKKYFVYVLASEDRKLSIGAANYITRKIFEHNNKSIGGTTSKYDMTKIVYIEEFESIENSLKKEKHLKGLKTKFLIQLINSSNPTWEDLYIGK